MKTNFSKNLINDRKTLHNQEEMVQITANTLREMWFCKENIELLGMKFPPKKGWIKKLSKQLFPKDIVDKLLSKDVSIKSNLQISSDITSVTVTEELLSKLLVNGVGLRNSVAKMLGIQATHGWRDRIIGTTISVDPVVLQHELDQSASRALLLNNKKKICKRQFRRAKSSVQSHKTVINSIKRVPVVSYQERQAILEAIGYTNYDEYQQSDLWKNIRYKIYAINKGKCQICGDKADAIHHRTYRRSALLGETLSDLIAICNQCHKSIEWEGNKKLEPKEVEHRLCILLAAK